jgi:hypothetical protein
MRFASRAQCKLAISPPCTRARGCAGVVPLECKKADEVWLSGRKRAKLERSARGCGATTQHVSVISSLYLYAVFVATDMFLPAIELLTEMFQCKRGTDITLQSKSRLIEVQACSQPVRSRTTVWLACAHGNTEIRSQHWWQQLLASSHLQQSEAALSSHFSLTLILQDGSPQPRHRGLQQVHEVSYCAHSAGAMCHLHVSMCQRDCARC